MILFLDKFLGYYKYVHCLFDIFIYLWLFVKESINSPRVIIQCKVSTSSEKDLKISFLLIKSHNEKKFHFLDVHFQTHSCSCPYLKLLPILKHRASS